MKEGLLIHSADSQSLPVVIIIRPSVELYVRPSQYTAKQNKFQVKTMLTTDETVCPAEWIIDDGGSLCRIIFELS